MEPEERRGIGSSNAGKGGFGYGALIESGPEGSYTQRVADSEPVSRNNWGVNDGGNDDGLSRQELITNPMATSREQLTMDLGKSDNSIFTQNKGCYLSRSKVFGLILLTLLLAVGVGVITHHLASKCDGSDTSPVEPVVAPGDGGSKKVTDVRLPLHIRPTYYKLDLIPKVNPAENFTITGRAKIHLAVLEATNKIVLHFKNITIHESQVTVHEFEPRSSPSADSTSTLTPTEGSDADVQLVHEHEIVKHEYDWDREFYNVTMKNALEVGKKYVIDIPYEAVLGDNLAGFYRSSYQDRSTNETRWLGVTQFQPTDARRAFPCFDEPAMKAEFEISIAKPQGFTTISNMNLKRQSAVDGMPGWTWDHYHKSVPMSTYLVAMVVSEFEKRESDPSLSKPKFAVWARKDAISQVEYARDIGPRILTFLETYFDIPFPLPKQDMIALPDFNAGAMENWGLITYRETAMLYDPKVSSDLSKQRVANVIAHELAHQWFGNLVTPSWWSDLWLNEGFASYVEYIGTDHVEPDLKCLEQFVVEEIQNVFSLDALDSSHPISVPVHHPDEINEIFDRISYGKGASIIRMMNHFLTEASFKQGLTNYLNEWKYNSTVQDNLWKALTDQAWKDKTLDHHMTVQDVMDTWTLQKGFPVIHVDRHYVGKHANFTQTKFQLIKNETMRKEYDSYRWWVPISYASPTFNQDFKKTEPEFWIKKNEKFNDHGIHVQKTDWLIVNVQQTGYYRVNYDLKNWQLIIDQLNENHTAIHTVNRAQLLDDALNLARADLLPYDVAFNVTQYLKNDDEYLPWESFFTALSYISSMLQKSPSYGLYKKYMRGLVKSQYRKVGFTQGENDPFLKRFHRLNIVSMACSTGDSDCVAEVKKLFTQWMNESNPDTNNPIPTNMRNIVYCNALRNGGEREWDFLWNRYNKSNVASEKNTILRSLACTKETWILNRYLSMAITPNSGIRKQDGTSVISSVARNEVGSFLAFNFVRDRWSDITKYFPVGLFSLGGIITSISYRLTTPFELMELKNFKVRNSNTLGAAARAVDQAIERVEANVAWYKDNYKTIEEWLQTNAKSDPDYSTELDVIES